MSELRANRKKTVEIVYCGHKLKGRILTVGERSVKFKIDRDGCRVMLLERNKVEVARG